MLSYAMGELVVIDTSVFISALLSGGNASRHVLRLCFLSELRPLIGNALFAEYESLIGRSHVFEKTPLSFDERQDYLNDFLSVCKWVNIYYLWRPNLKDEADNHLIELAVAGGATTIVTENIRDFKGSELVFSQITITTAHEFIECRK